MTKNVVKKIREIYSSAGRLHDAYTKNMTEGVDPAPLYTRKEWIECIGNNLPVVEDCSVDTLGNFCYIDIIMAMMLVDFSKGDSRRIAELFEFSHPKTVAMIVYETIRKINGFRRGGYWNNANFLGVPHSHAGFVRDERLDMYMKRLDGYFKRKRDDE